MIGSGVALVVAALVLLPRRSARAVGRRRLHSIALAGGAARAAPSERRGTKLPVIAVLTTAALGFLLAGRTGLVGAALSAPFVATGVHRLAARAAAQTDAATRSAVPLLLDMTSAALRAGVPTATAIGVVATAAPEVLRAPLRRTAALLRLGAAPSEAWAALASDSVLGSAALLAVRSADSGVRLADSFERHATELRAQLASGGIARAHRVATLALLPLGLCFLPAFVCIGIVPVVVGTAASVFASHP